MPQKKKIDRALVPTQARALSAKEFLDLADVPPEIEWFANITNPQTYRIFKRYFVALLPVAALWKPATGAAGAAARAADFLALRAHYPRLDTFDHGTGAGFAWRGIAAERRVRLLEI